MCVLPAAHLALPVARGISATLAAAASTATSAPPPVLRVRLTLISAGGRARVAVAVAAALPGRTAAVFRVVKTFAARSGAVARRAARDRTPGRAIRVGPIYSAILAHSKWGDFASLAARQDSPVAPESAARALVVAMDLSVLTKGYGVTATVGCAARVIAVAVASGIPAAPILPVTTTPAALRRNRCVLPAASKEIPVARQSTVLIPV